MDTFLRRAENMSESDIEKGSEVVEELMGLGGGKPLPEHMNPDAYQVDFDSLDDPLNPQNWPTSRKYTMAPLYLFAKILRWLMLGNRLYTAVIVCFSAFFVCFDSATFAPGASRASKDLSVGREAGVLGTSLYILGFGTGPTIWAPGSELVGRRWPLCAGILGCAIFTIACATSNDIQTLLICRFFGGVFGASPLSVVPGVIADMYSDHYRGTAIAIYALTVFGGPFLAPIAAGFLNESFGWRWTLYLPAIIGFFTSGLLCFSLKETYAPFILVEKAVKLRRLTGNWAIHASQEKVEFEMSEMVCKYFLRPLRMLFTEPIIFAVTLYMSFIYGLAYALLVAYPYVFGEVYGKSSGVATLPFLGLFLGIVLSVALIIYRQTFFVKKLEANKRHVVPEWRLPPTFVGAFAFTIGLFWYVQPLPQQFDESSLTPMKGSVGPDILHTSIGWLPRPQECSLASVFCASSRLASHTLWTLICHCEFRVQ
jgi:MFS transporter, DHA1 family, multidrug resistance protein